MKDLRTTPIELLLPTRKPNCYSAKNNVKPVNFYCTAPNAKAVCLVGDFNGWNPLANPMQRDASGSWTVQVQLHHGHRHYLFLVDGEPMLDANAHGIARNERNERVSLIAVS
jgi:1,4-alpha-glucan branching enzyme